MENDPFEPILPETPEMPELPKGPVHVPPEMLLSYIASNLADNIVVLPMKGWEAIIEAVREFGDEGLLQKLTDLQVPVVPIMLEGLEKKEESRIILPNDMPKGDGKIITLS